MVRIASHCAVWLAVIASTIEELAAGWRPLEDNAAIAIKALQSLSLHPPLVGLASSAATGSGHVIYDPGPLLFYSLALPVHVSPTYGLLIGAMVIIGIALSLAIESAWSTGQWVGGAIMALAVLDLWWLMPSVFESLPWNAFLPLLLLPSIVLLAWAVALGRTGWWPVLVVIASLAAQSQLLFVAPAAALTGTALVLGGFATWRAEVDGSDARDGGKHVASGAWRRWRWVLVGFAVGGFCWAAPLIQETGSNGNLSALGASRGLPTLGWRAGLRQAGQIFSGRPLWATRLPSSAAGLFGLFARPQVWQGALALCLLVLTSIAALLKGRKALGTLAVIATIATLSVVVTFAAYPRKNLFSLGYLINIIWIVNILEWSVLLWALSVILSDLWRLAGARPLQWSLSEPVLAIGLVGLLGLVAFAGLRSVSNSPKDVNWNHAEASVTDRATAAIERLVPKGPVRLDVEASAAFPQNVILGNNLSEAIAYRLLVDGWSPGVGPLTETYTGLELQQGGHFPKVLVTVVDGRVSTVRRQR